MGPITRPLQATGDVGERVRDKGFCGSPRQLFALIGWSPGQNEELLRRTSSRAVFVGERRPQPAVRRGQAGGANRHYLKVIDPDRWRHSRSRTCAIAVRSPAIYPPTRARGSSRIAGMAQSVDRCAARRSSGFRFHLPAAERGARFGAGESAREELAASPRLTDNDMFRAPRIE